MENLETLMGKYGEEGDKLVYRVLDSGSPFPESFFKDFIEMLSHYNEQAKSYTRHIDPEIKGPLEIPITNMNPEILKAYSKILFESKSYLPKLKNEV